MIDEQTIHALQAASGVTLKAASRALVSHLHDPEGRANRNQAAEGVSVRVVDEPDVKESAVFVVGDTSDGPGVSSDSVEDEELEVGGTVSSFGASQEGDRYLDTRETTDGSFEDKSASNVVLGTEAVEGHFSNIEDIEGSTSGRVKDGRIIDGCAAIKGRPDVHGGVTALSPVPMVNTKDRSGGSGVSVSNVEHVGNQTGRISDHVGSNRDAMTRMSIHNAFVNVGGISSDLISVDNLTDYVL